MVRFFGDPDVTHVAGKVDPQSDVDTIKTELILADIATVEKAIPRLEKEAKRDKAGAAKLEAAQEGARGAERGPSRPHAGADRGRASRPSTSCTCSP